MERGNRSKKADTLISLMEDKSCKIEISLGESKHISEFDPIGKGEKARGLASLLHWLWI